ncbi:hypothetical protein FA15DRAFT_121036 [Coprinopsis marcescibilis]|uniref:Uncharacterized protein n=1 Tax=Coprinopsis marcescibilis TaxID=230819 RepID=A0A5C3L580_COPMA|nr:hypothetical protein FA15DRAFT_121036 [Coprinopsis marcescibilis]
MPGMCRRDAFPRRGRPRLRSPRNHFKRPSPTAPKQWSLQIITFCNFCWNQHFVFIHVDPPSIRSCHSQQRSHISRCLIIFIWAPHIERRAPWEVQGVGKSPTVAPQTRQRYCDARANPSQRPPEIFPSSTLLSPPLAFPGAAGYFLQVQFY